ncbi:MAG: hypothetical protein OXQ28_06590 [Acidobacteriota bacterium]|nr:hypothetical protein [Acidobacteriota bacterium]
MQSRRIAATVVALALALSATAAGAAVDPWYAGAGGPAACALVVPAGALMPVSVSSNCQGAAEKVKQFCDANPTSWLCGFLSFIVVLACSGSN